MPSFIPSVLGLGFLLYRNLFAEMLTIERLALESYVLRLPLFLLLCFLRVVVIFTTAPILPCRSRFVVKLSPCVVASPERSLWHHYGINMASLWHHYGITMALVVRRVKRSKRKKAKIPAIGKARNGNGTDSTASIENGCERQYHIPCTIYRISLVLVRDQNHPIYSIRRRVPLSMVNSMHLHRHL